jgi:hypothetical protein
MLEWGWGMYYYVSNLFINYILVIYLPSLIHVTYLFPYTTHCPLHKPPAPAGIEIMKQV